MLTKAHNKVHQSQLQKEASDTSFTYILQARLLLLIIYMLVFPSSFTTFQPHQLCHPVPLPLPPTPTNTTPTLPLCHLQIPLPQHLHLSYPHHPACHLRLPLPHHRRHLPSCALMSHLYLPTLHSLFHPTRTVPIQTHTRTHTHTRVVPWCHLEDSHVQKYLPTSVCMYNIVHHR